MEKYNFVGKNLNRKEGKSFKKSLDSWREEALFKLENEINKTSEDIILIDKAKNILNEELKNLGLKPNFDIKLEQIHIFSSKSFKKGGEYNAIDQQVNVFHSNSTFCFIIDVLDEFIKKIIYKNKEKRDEELGTLIHEFIHSHAHNKFKIEKKEKENLISNYRTGYQVDRFNDKNLFSGFDEAVVDKMSYDLLFHYHKNFGKDSFGKKIYESLVKLDSGYLIHIETIDKIITRIAEVNYETNEEVWKRFKLGEFTGNMMHLRDVEKAYGAGSLRILANMPAEAKYKNLTYYYEYFATNNKNARSKIEKYLLSESEKEKLNYHVGKIKDTK